MSFKTPILRTANALSRCSCSRPTVMPLRSKITDPSFNQGRRTYALSNDIAELTKEQPGDDPDDVTFTNQYNVRIIDLNRPKKLNSLNGSMARKIIARLKEYQKSQMVTAVIVKGQGRAFCAGGDVAALAQLNKEGPEGQQQSMDYFALEYKLDHLIATYTKPYIAFMDGITMGGGVGLSVHAPFRIATENTVFAMPETTIGFFPEVGASFFLPRMDGRLGTYLALTSEQLKGVDVFYQGIATHYIHSTSLPQLEARLAELVFKDYASAAERYAILNSTIEEFCTGLPSPRPALSGNLRRAIDLCFSAEHQTPLDILDALSAVEAQTPHKDVREWASRTAATINERSPTSVAVTLRQLQVSRKWNIAQTFQHEHNIASRFMSHHDFVEGVTARLIERKKGRPNWQPNTLKEVTDAQVDSFFGQPLELALLNDAEGSRFSEYPHADLGLPTEAQILSVKNRRRGASTEEIVQHFVDAKKGKQGVKEKVEEVLERADADAQAQKESRAEGRNN